MVSADGAHALFAQKQAGNSGAGPEDGVWEGVLQRQQAKDNDEVQRLIDPDGLDDVVAGLERVDDNMGDENDGNGGWRGSGKEDKRGGIGGRVVEVDLPAFAFVGGHP